MIRMGVHDRKNTHAFLRCHKYLFKKLLASYLKMLELFNNY